MRIELVQIEEHEPSEHCCGPCCHRCSVCMIYIQIAKDKVCKCEEAQKLAASLFESGELSWPVYLKGQDQ